METKDVILQLRNRENLSQEELRKALRDAARRCPAGKPAKRFPTETLRACRCSFDVSINTLLGSPRRNICQCCGMPLEDEILCRQSRIGLVQREEYSQMVLAVSSSMRAPSASLISRGAYMATEAWLRGAVRAHMEAVVPQPGTGSWKQIIIKRGGCAIRFFVIRYFFRRNFRFGFRLSVSGCRSGSAFGRVPVSPPAGASLRGQARSRGALSREELGARFSVRHRTRW